MSQDTKGIINLDYIVELVLLDLDDYSFTKYKKFLQYAILGYQDLNLYTMQNIKVAYLPVAENKTVDLPDDFVDYTKIAIDVGGKLQTLSLNEDLMLTRLTDDCGNLTNENTGACSVDEIVFPNYGYHFAPHYRNGQYVGELYSGTGGAGTDGSYRIDRDKRKIAFSSDLTLDTVVLEYKSSGVAGDGSTNVPRQCIEALRAYIHWKRKEYNDKIAQSEKERLRQSYYIEYEKLRDLEFDFTLSEYYESRASTYKMIPKR